MARKRKRRIWLYILLSLLVMVIAFIVYYRLVTRMVPPADLDPKEMGYTLETVGEANFQSGNSWLRITDNIEMYIEGNPLELGIMHGLLARGLIEAQESYFVEQIKVMIPSE